MSAKPSHNKYLVGIVVVVFAAVGTYDIMAHSSDQGIVQKGTHVIKTNETIINWFNVSTFSNFKLSFLEILMQNTGLLWW